MRTIGPFTVDASVWLSAFNPSEPHHVDSARLLALIREAMVPLVLPTLVLPEIAAATCRISGDPALGAEFSAHVATLPDLVLVPLDRAMADSAVEAALHQGLKGSDAVYAATARRFGAVLVTLDRQQRERMPAEVVARYPAEVLQGVETDA